METNLARQTGIQLNRSGHLLVQHAAEQLQTGQDFSLRDRRFHNGGDHGDPDILGGDVVSRGDGGNVDICWSAFSPWTRTGTAGLREAEMRQVTTRGHGTTTNHSFGRPGSAG
jgi:hypothetical protein